LPRGGIDDVDGFSQILARFDEIVPLHLQELHPLFLLLVLFERQEIDRSHLFDFFPHLFDTFAGLFGVKGFIHRTALQGVFKFIAHAGL